MKTTEAKAETLPTPKPGGLQEAWGEPRPSQDEDGGTEPKLFTKEQPVNPWINQEVETGMHWKGVSHSWPWKNGHDRLLEGEGVF